jgi:hypothetical protein
MFQQMAAEKKVTDSQALDGKVGLRVPVDGPRLVQAVVQGTGSARRWAGYPGANARPGYMVMAGLPASRHTFFAGRHEPVSDDFSILFRTKIRPTEL